MLERLFKYLSNRLCHPRLAVHLALLAVVLTLPAVAIGWQLDDQFLRLVMLGKAMDGASPLEAFALVDRGAVHDYIDRGIIPWWTVDDFHVSFLRALSLLTMWLDYRLWPESPVPMHIHSLLWFGALVAAATALYRRILGGGAVAGLAALLYAFDEAHAAPASWLANRSVLLATLFGVACLIAHDRWRQTSWRAGAVLSPVFLAFALASSEAALATAGYLAAYTVFLEQAPSDRRLAALLPNGAVLLTWAILYRTLGFGVVGSGIYLDPLANPIAFTRALVERIPHLLLGQWTPFPADAGFLIQGGTARLLWLLALTVITLLTVTLLPLLRRDRVARFWCAGMLLALLPICATFPSNRNLFFVGLGAMGLTAQFLAGGPWAAREPQRLARRVLNRVMAIVLIAAHLVIAPLLMPIQAYSTKFVGDATARAVASLPTDPALSEQSLIVLNAPDHLLYVSYIPALRTLDDRPTPRRVHALVPVPVAFEVSRLDAQTLEVRLERGLFSGPLGLLFRDPERPIAIGTDVELTGIRVTVIEATEGGEPVTLLFRFAVPLEHPSLRWVRWQDGGYVPFTPPGPGETLKLDAALGFLESLSLKSTHADL